MAKKLGKFLLGAAVLGGAAAAAYMYLQKKGVVSVTPENVDEDYDDFSEDAEECPSRNYVSLTPDTAEVAEECSSEECPSEECTGEECPSEECTGEECVSAECCCESSPSEEPIFTEAVSAESLPSPEEAPIPDAVEEFFDEEKTEA